MKQLLKFFKGYEKEAILGPLFKLLEASFELLVPLVIAAIIRDGISGQGNKQFIVQMGGVLILLALVGLISSVTAQYFAAKAAVGFSAGLRQKLFAHLQSLSYSEIDELTTSSMITRMTSDANQMQNGVNMFLRLFLRSPFIVFGAMIMAFTIDVKAALIFTVAIPILFVVVFAVIIVTIPLFSKVQNKTDRLLGLARENLSGVRVVRAFGREQLEEDEFFERNGALQHFQLFAGRISALMNPMTYVIINVALVILIYQGGLQVQVGNLDQGAVVALVNYMSQILVELIKFANLIITITKAIACAKRVNAVFAMESSLKVPDVEKAVHTMSQETKGFVVMDDVSFTYNNAGAPSLQHISFHVDKGQTVGIIGGTGSGKSTLINVLSHSYDATQGQVRIGGVNVNQYDQKFLRQKIAIVMQKAVLFAGTIRSNLQWGDEAATDEQMWHALEVAQATEVVKNKEAGLDSEVEQNGRNFSGGQKQRLTIARALCSHPDILILDDSSSALDYATDAALRRSLKTLDSNLCVFIISQRTASVKDADLILVLNDGQLVGSGTHDELLETCEIYKEIHRSQQK